VNLTEGLGAGANPDVGQQLLKAFAEIEKMLDRNTKMVLSLQDGWWYRYRCGSSNCTISQRTRNSYCGIVTLPFLFEGKVSKKAKIGIENYANR
jgi:cell division protein FtsZ